MLHILSDPLSYTNQKKKKKKRNRQEFELNFYNILSVIEQIDLRHLLVTKPKTIMFLFVAQTKYSQGNHAVFSIKALYQNLKEITFEIKRLLLTSC